jgi:hypothetical protein
VYTAELALPLGKPVWAVPQRIGIKIEQVNGAAKLEFAAIKNKGLTFVINVRNFPVPSTGGNCWTLILEILDSSTGTRSGKIFRNWKKLVWNNIWNIRRNGTPVQIAAAGSIFTIINVLNVGKRPRYKHKAKNMSSIRLIHWNEPEATEKSLPLEKAGFQVNYQPPSGPKFIQELENENPLAVLIDLSRLPSQGRDLALSIRKRAGTRQIPLIFVGGDTVKVQKVQELLPDATFGHWEEILDLIDLACETNTGNLVVPDSVFAAYSGKPLAEKLGIKPGFRVAYVAADDHFTIALGDLPRDVQLIPEIDPNADITVWFLRSIKNLKKNLDSILEQSTRNPVWMAWPKKGSEMESDLNQQIVRETGMTAGMVDYKICSIDHNWSALLFKWRGVK